MPSSPVRSQVGIGQQLGHGIRLDGLTEVVRSLEDSLLALTSAAAEFASA